MNFKFTAQMSGKRPSISREQKIDQWKKESANGKWFWVFKRTALWLTLMIVMFGAVEFYSPETLSFDSNEFFTAFFMFIGFFIATLIEWSKSEKQFNISLATEE